MLYVIYDKRSRENGEREGGRGVVRSGVSDDVTTGVWLFGMSETFPSHGGIPIFENCQIRKSLS